MSSPAPLPKEIHRSAQRGELQKVVKWLHKEGPVDALLHYTFGVRVIAETLLHAAAGYGQLEMVRELLKRGASIDLQSNLGLTALMSAAIFGHLSIVLVLLQHSANLDLQDISGATALMMAAGGGHEACVQALLRAKANTELFDAHGRTALKHAETKGHTAIAELIRQHTAPPQAAAAPPAAPPDAGEPAESSPAPLPLEIFRSAERGELQKVVKWLRKGGLVSALCSASARNGLASTASLLHVAAGCGHLEMVRVLLNRGASVDLPSSLGATALMYAADNGHHFILFVLLEHSADPDLQSSDGRTALMMAAGEQGQETEGNTALMMATMEQGQEACVQTLLRAKADTELLDENGETALQWAESSGHTSIAKLIRQHAPPPQPAAAMEAMLAEQAAQAARADAAMEELLAQEEAEQAKQQAPSKKSKKKKAGRAAAAGNESSEAPPAAAPAPPPAAAPKPAVSAAARAEAALRAVFAGGGLSALEVALAAAPREVREGGVGVEARARCDRLLDTQQEAERKARQEAAAEAASLVAAEQVRGVAARDAVRAVAASKAREVAAAAAAAAAVATEAAATAEAEANALERAMADGGEGGGSGAAGPSKASEVAAPDQYMCSITAEIMTDPVNTVRLSLPQAIPLVLPAFATPSLRRHTNSLCFYIAPPERKTGRRPYVRAQRYRAVAQDPQHFACDGRRAREQAAHPVPLSPQPHPRFPRGGRVAPQT